MAAAAPVLSRSLFAHQNFLFYFWARGFSEFSYQIAAVCRGLAGLCADQQRLE